MVKKSWPSIILGAIFSGAACFVAGAFALVHVGFSTYALANDWLPTLFVIGLTIGWTGFSISRLVGLAKRERGLHSASMVLAVAGAIVSFAASFAVAWVKARANLDAAREFGRVAPTALNLRGPDQAGMGSLS